ncbi:MAG: haloacid dehalogenase type II [Pseudomonadota bacterium]
MRLSDHSVLTFDCYGTLIDWETGITDALAPWLARAGLSPERDEILEAFARAEAAQEAAAPGMLYPQILARVHSSIAEDFKIASDPRDAAAFGASVKHWPAFPDSADALAYLKQHFKLVILSNIDRASFAHSNAKLAVQFDAIYTAQDIGSYKPDPRNFTYLLDHLKDLGLEKDRILHTAESLHHDHIPGKAAGLHTCWIHRRAGKRGHGATSIPDQEVRPDFRFESMAAMAEAHRDELGA